MPLTNPVPLTMYDSVDVSQIPAGSAAVAGYVNGRYQTYPTLVARFPSAHVLGIAVSSRFDAECLDVEAGDATNATAPGWVKRQLARGVKKPVVYTSVSNAHALLAALAAEGIKREEIRLWTAHYTFRSHLCDAKCGFGMPTVADATQYHDRALGRNLDASLVQGTFFAQPKPRPAPAPKPKPVPKPVPKPAPKPAPPATPAPHGEPKNQGPFTRAVWPVPLPAWFWNWAQWRKDGKSYARPANAPRMIPLWAFARYLAL